MNPLVSIVVPTHNNEATIVRTLNSIVQQTLRDIEIIVVDDASADATVSLCRDAQLFDPRISVIPLPENQTALQTRRIGVEHSAGTYIMFCDADDELAPQAAEEASSFAVGGAYDVVHFGSTIVSTSGTKHGAWERALDPFGNELFGHDIILSSAFGQTGSKINGCIWNKLYERRLLEEAWKPIDRQLRLPRAQDVYQTLLILAKAQRYGGLSSSLYRYNFGAGKSGNVASRDAFQHFLASSQTYQAIRQHLTSGQLETPSEFDAEEMLMRLRDQFVENQIGYWLKLPRPAQGALADLLEQWGPDPVLSVLAARHANKVRQVVEAFSRLEVAQQEPASSGTGFHGSRRIALLGNIAGSGGVQKVMSVQAELLTRAGYTVTVLSFDHEPEDRMYDFPPQVTHQTIGPRGELAAGITGLVSSLREGAFGAVLNHDNYSTLFPWIAAVTRAMGVPSALFLHSFSLRALHDFREVFAYLPEIARTFDTTVTLSEADRMWWEASGVRNVVALPNFGPDSDGDEAGYPNSQDENSDSTPLDREETDLLWVGRLQDGTKNVSGVLEVFAQIVTHRPETTLTIVGGEQRPGELARLEQLADRLGVRERVSFVGQVQDVGAWYRSARVFLSTGSIEGFNLTLVEAQTFGLPVAMYDLPYLETVIGNPGIVSVEWGASENLADAAVRLLEDPERAEKVGAAGREFAQRFSIDAYDKRLKSIVHRLCNGQLSRQTSAVDSDLGTALVTVPASVIAELYRLYERMQRRTSSELSASKRDTGNLRKNLVNLKRSLADSKAIQIQLDKAIAQLEKKGNTAQKSASSPKRVKNLPELGQNVPGVWPLWAREGTQPLSVPASAAFDDINPTDPVALPAAWALDSGLLGPTTDRQFDGAKQVTRYDLVAMLYRLAGSPETGSTSVLYRDLEADDPVIAWAVQREILKRTSSDDSSKALPSWNPGGPLLRRSAAMILFRAAGSPQYPAPRVSPYLDLAVNQKFYKEMCWAAHQGVLPAVRRADGTLVFDEKRLMTRSETVVALFNQMVGPLAGSNDG